MLIGITGKAGSGKDTVADFLVEKHGFTSVSFSDILKNGIKVLFDLSEEQLHDTDTKEKKDPRWGFTPRQLMQWFGTDILRNRVRQDFFIVHMDRFLSVNRGKNIVISDVRFENECRYIKQHYGSIINIIRPGLREIENNSHESEQLNYPTDQDIYNDCTIPELYLKIQKFIR